MRFFQLREKGMDDYIYVLVGLVAVNTAIVIWKRREFFKTTRTTTTSSGSLSSLYDLSDLDNDDSEQPAKETTHSFDATVQTIQRRYLPVYVAVFAADWLQGPYIYAVYKQQHGLTDRMVALLFVTGFACGAVSSTCVGQLSDRFGRKKACIAYCILFTLSSLSVLLGSLPMLFFGRALGGVSTTLLFSTFEAWLVADFRTSGIDQDAAQVPLKHIFGITAILNSVVAIVAGVLGQLLVSKTQNEKAPFVASVVCLALALRMITTTWTENVGEADADSDQNYSPDGHKTLDWLAGLPVALFAQLNLVVLGFFLCAFEGTIYVFVHFWPQAIMSARASEDPSASSPSFGLIFASMMSAMCLGSLVFKIIYNIQDPASGSLEAIEMSAILGAVSLLTITLSSREYSRYVGFLLYEGCVGLYFPAMASLKANLVDNEHRAKIYAMMRLALNVFVLVVLGTVEEGDAPRDHRFLLCSCLLVLGVVATRWRF